MSAYICHPKTFMGIAAFAVRKDRYGSQNVGDYTLQTIFDEMGNNSPRIIVDDMKPHEKASLIANILREQNIRSVQERYPNIPVKDLPGDESMGVIKMSARSFADIRDYPPMIIIKACHNVAYQSCETSDWPTTQAHTLLRTIEDAAVRALPGYDEAPWGIE